MEIARRQKASEEHKTWILSPSVAKGTVLTGVWYRAVCYMGTNGPKEPAVCFSGCWMETLFSPERHLCLGVRFHSDGDTKLPFFIHRYFLTTNFSATSWMRTAPHDPFISKVTFYNYDLCWDKRTSLAPFSQHTEESGNWKYFLSRFKTGLFKFWGQWKTYSVIQNDCQGFNNLAYTIHLR